MVQKINKIGTTIPDECPFTFGGLLEADVARDDRAIVLFGWLEPACLTISRMNTLKKDLPY